MNFKKTILLTAAFSQIANAATTEQKIASVEERLDNIELNQSLNYITFGGSFIYRHDEYTRKASDVLDNATYSLDRIYFTLDTKVNISPKTKVYARFGMGKYFNTDQNVNNEDIDVTWKGSRQENGPQTYVDQAFLVRQLSDSWSFTAGRLPVYDGPPFEMYDGVSRQGSYPLLAVNFAMDGIAFSYAPKLNNQTFKFHFIWAPSDHMFLDTWGIPSTKHTDGDGNKVTTDYDKVGEAPTVLMEYSKSNIGFADFFETVFFWQKWKPTMYGTKVDTDVFSWTAALKNIKNTSLSLSATYYGSINRSEVFDSTASGGVGFMTDSTDKTTTKGNAIDVMATYNLPFWVKPILGVEWYKGTKGNLLWNDMSETLSRFHQTRGNAYHTWLAMNFSDNYTVRVGYYLQDHDYGRTALGFGAAPKDQFKESSMYANLRVDF